MSMSDDRRVCFLISGISKKAVPDMEIEWLQSQGATSNDRMDAWEEFLTIKGFPYTTYPDARRSWLESLGFTGATEDMLNQYWQDCPTAVEETKWIDAEGWVDSEEWIG